MLGREHITEEKMMDELDFKIVKAVNLLERCGYNVTKPDNRPKTHYSLEGLAAGGFLTGGAFGTYFGAIAFDLSPSLESTIFFTACAILMGFAALIILKEDEWKDEQPKETL